MLGMLPLLLSACRRGRGLQVGNSPNANRAPRMASPTGGFLLVCGRPFPDRAAVGAGQMLLRSGDDVVVAPWGLRRSGPSYAASAAAPTITALAPPDTPCGRVAASPAGLQLLLLLLLLARCDSSRGGAAAAATRHAARGRPPADAAADCTRSPILRLRTSRLLLLWLGGPPDSTTARRRQLAATGRLSGSSRRGPLYREGATSKAAACSCSGCGCGRGVVPVRLSRASTWGILRFSSSFSFSSAMPAVLTPSPSRGVRGSAPGVRGPLCRCCRAVRGGGAEQGVPHSPARPGQDHVGLRVPGGAAAVTAAAASVDLAAL